VPLLGFAASQLGHFANFWFSSDDSSTDLQNQNRRPSLNARSSQNASMIANVPEETASNRPFERTHTPNSAISGVANIDLQAPGKGQDASLMTSPPKSPNERYPPNSKKRAQPETYTAKNPELGENKSIHQSKATTRNSHNDDYWRGTPIQAPGHQKILFDADRDSPMMNSTPPIATTRVYDPRTHIFRSKKALDSQPGPLSVLCLFAEY
jgi:hypothetical protein